MHLSSGRNQNGKMAQNQNQKHRVLQVHFHTGHLSNSDHRQPSLKTALDCADFGHFRVRGPKHFPGSNRLLQLRQDHQHRKGHARQCHLSGHNPLHLDLSAGVLLAE